MWFGSKLIAAVMREKNNEEDSLSNRCCLLPKDMRPGKKYFEYLGFMFEEIGDSVLYQAMIPRGWSLTYESADDEEKFLIDESGIRRAVCVYHNDEEERTGYLELI